jgi:hypothetical protein
MLAAPAGQHAAKRRRSAGEVMKNSPEVRRMEPQRDVPQGTPAIIPAPVPVWRL